MPNYDIYKNEAPWYNDRGEIKKVVIENGVTNIGNYAFYDSGNLTSVDIPNSVTSIGDCAFQDCYGLTSIEIPNSVTSIEKCAFWQCSGLTSVTIGNSVTSIGNHAFIRCKALTSVEIPNSVTSIGKSAFCFCESLASVTIGNSVTSIGDYAFNNCSRLTSIEIPSSVASIGYKVFAKCPALTSITVEKGNTKYDSRDNCNAIIETSSNKLIQGYKNTVIPNSVTSIGKSAFEDCVGLTSIEIPNSVTSIGESAFEACENLISITFKGSTPPEFGEEVFEYVDNSIPVYVPANSMEAYKNALGGLGVSNIKALPLSLDDKTAYTQKSQIDDIDVSYTRNFTNTNWQAIYLPFSLKYEDWKDDFEVARINGIRQYDDYNIGSINRTELEVVKMTNDDSVIYPNTPYLIRAKTPGEKTLSIENTTVYESKANSIECSTTTELFTFIGTYKVMNFSGIGAYHNCYVLDGYGRNIIEGKTFLLPYRWFMKIDERESVYGIKNNTAKEISIRVVGEETTGIANIQHTSPNTQTYDLNGRKVNENNLKPGMYVKNGRKFVVK